MGKGRGEGLGLVRGEGGRGSWDALRGVPGGLGRSWGALEGSWQRSRGVLGRLWALLSEFLRNPQGLTKRERKSTMSGFPGASWRGLGGISEPLGGVLRSPGCLFDASWRILGARRIYHPNFGASWRPLGRVYQIQTRKHRTDGEVGDPGEE